MILEDAQKLRVIKKIDSMMLLFKNTIYYKDLEEIKLRYIYKDVSQNDYKIDCVTLKLIYNIYIIITKIVIQKKNHTMIKLTNKEKGQIRKEIEPLIREKARERYGFLFKGDMNEDLFKSKVPGSWQITYQVNWLQSFQFWNKDKINIKGTLWFTDNSKPDERHSVNYLDYNEDIVYNLEQERRVRKLKALGL
jgi:predicted transposase YbfD/YdcC